MIYTNIQERVLDINSSRSTFFKTMVVREVDIVMKIWESSGLGLLNLRRDVRSVVGVWSLTELGA